MPTIHTSALSGQEVMTLLEDYIQDAIPEVIGFVMSVIGAILVYVIGVRVIKFLRKVLKKMLQRHSVDEGVQQFLEDTLF